MSLSTIILSLTVPAILAMPLLSSLVFITHFVLFLNPMILGSPLRLFLDSAMLLNPIVLFLNPAILLSPVVLLLDSAILLSPVLLLLDTPVARLITLIEYSPLVVVNALIPVTVMVGSAILDIAVPSDILPTVPSDLIWKPVVQNEHPWPTIIRSTIPAVVAIDVVKAPVIDDIIRVAYRNRKPL
jgi:hypothetical protein